MFIIKTHIQFVSYIFLCRWCMTKMPPHWTFTKFANIKNRNIYLIFKLFTLSFNVVEHENDAFSNAVLYTLEFVYSTRHIRIVYENLL